ncbi:hypothetical protein SELMODRAFT_407523 [Selaginella moellendorffii]|uniref:Uncharacterized protein n=1 Tax=Selaginella moellendorffii TaxID=88036 RepID=D8R5W6_SELML|nr:hypothetical protein SELMODRAFT_407523 [Selaginella moellendorffii]
MKAVLVFLVFAISTFQIALSSSPSSSSSRELLDEAEIYGVSVVAEPASNSSLVNLSSDMDDWEGGKHRGDSNNNNNNINININIFCKNKSMDGDHKKEDDKKFMDHEHKEEEEQKSMDGNHKEEEEDKHSMDHEQKEEDKKRYFP